MITLIVTITRRTEMLRSFQCILVLRNVYGLTKYIYLVKGTFIFLLFVKKGIDITKKSY